MFLEISCLIILSLDPPKKDLKIAGPGPSFQKSRVRVQKISHVQRTRVPVPSLISGVLCLFKWK